MEIYLAPINMTLIPRFIWVVSLNFYVRGRGLTLTFVSHKPSRKGSHVIGINFVDIIEEGFVFMEIYTPRIHTCDRPWILVWESRPVQRDIHYWIQSKLYLTVTKNVHQCICFFDVHCADHPAINILGHDGPLIFTVLHVRIHYLEIIRIDGGRVLGGRSGCYIYSSGIQIG